MTTPAATTDPDGTPPRYWAFISYAHADESHAIALHRRIEGYRIPARLHQGGGPVPRRLRPVFRDRSELPAAAELGRRIELALLESRFLVVVCSPRSAASRWVGREIEAFRALGRDDRILAYVVDGEPPGCFHPALLAPAAGGGVVEPLAADARPGRDGRDAPLKLIAGMLGVGFDALRQRELQARLRRLVVAAAVAVAVAGLATTLAAWALVERGRAERQTAVALERLERNLTDKGIERFDAGGAAESLPWLCEALRLVEGPAWRREGPDRSRLHRTRLALVMRSLPEPVWRVPERVERAAWSADGRLLATAAGDDAWIWDVAEQRLVAGPLRHPLPVMKVVFCPRSATLLTICGDPFGRNGRGAARLWRAADGAAVGGWLEHEGRERPARRIESADWVASGVGTILDGAFSRDGTWVATACDTGEARLWNAATGAGVGEPMRHPGEVIAVAFGRTDDGETVVTACRDDLVRLWSVPGCRETGGRFPHEHVRVGPLLHSSGLWITTIVKGWRYAGEVGEAQVFSLRSGEPVAPPFRLGAGVVDWRQLDGPSAGYGYAANVGSPMLFAAGDDGVARGWADFLDYVHAPRSWRHSEAPITAVQACGDGLVLTCGGHARLWRPDTGEPACPPFAGGADLIAAAVGSPLVLTAAAGEATVWRLPPVTTRLLGPTVGFAGDVRVSADGARLCTLAAGSAGHAIRIWDAATGARLQVDAAEAERAWRAAEPFAAPGPSPIAVRGGPPVALAGAGRAAARRLGDRDLLIETDGPAGGTAVTRRLRLPGPPVAAALDPRGRMLAVVGLGIEDPARPWWPVDLWIQAWDVATGEPLAPPGRLGAAVSSRRNRFEAATVRFLDESPTILVHARLQKGFVVHTLPLAPTSASSADLSAAAAFQGRGLAGSTPATAAADPAASAALPRVASGGAGSWAAVSALNAVERGAVPIATAVVRAASGAEPVASAFEPPVAARVWLADGRPEVAAECLGATLEAGATDPLLSRLRAEARCGLADWDGAAADLVIAERWGGLGRLESLALDGADDAPAEDRVAGLAVELALAGVARLLESGRTGAALELLRLAVERSAAVHGETSPDHATVLQVAGELAGAAGDVAAEAAYTATAAEEDGSDAP